MGILFLLTAVMLSDSAFGQLRAQLVNIRYYETDNGGEYPVKVCVRFDTGFHSPDKLKFIIRYGEGVTGTTQVRDYDSASVYYTFYTQKDVNSTFDIYLEDRQGNRSQVYRISARPTDKNIIKTDTQ
ncbi:MAG: hypothetical protein J6Y24_08575 [Bacteroidales bacterium]|nr:hypothetical protein [Bacteroidales bacterium]